MKKDTVYYIPYKFRKVENMHIVLWLIKDACWALNLKIPGMLMIIPTMTVAILITYQTRKITSEFFHNLAVDIWIIANCTWMAGEFFHLEENLIGPYGLRQFSLIPFSIGLLILGYYYLILKNKPGFQEKIMQQTDEVIKSKESDTSGSEQG
jgi:hypothetical protein